MCSKHPHIGFVCTMVSIKRTCRACCRASMLAMNLAPYVHYFVHVVTMFRVTSLSYGLLTSWGFRVEWMQSIINPYQHQAKLTWNQITHQFKTPVNTYPNYPQPQWHTINESQSNNNIGTMSQIVVACEGSPEEWVLSQTRDNHDAMYTHGETFASAASAGASAPV